MPRPSRAFAAGLLLASAMALPAAIGPAVAQHPGSIKDAYPQAMPMPVSTMPAWQGFYLGGHAGGLSGEITADGAPGAIDLKGFAGGVYVGYNIQRDRMVYGIEADGNWTGASHEIVDGTIKAAVATPWTAGVRGRLGLAMDSVLVYLTAGVAWTEVDVKLTDMAVPESVRASETDVGYVIGGGAELKMTDRISGRLELLHYGFKDFGGKSGVTGIDLDATTIRGGVAVHLQR